MLEDFCTKNYGARYGIVSGSLPIVMNNKNNDKKMGI